eukprot:7163989-Prymnesium_polylepis.1
MLWPQRECMSCATRNTPGTRIHRLRPHSEDEPDEVQISKDTPGVFLTRVVALGVHRSLVLTHATSSRNCKCSMLYFLLGCASAAASPPAQPPSAPPLYPSIPNWELHSSLDCREGYGA